MVPQYVEVRPGACVVMVGMPVPAAAKNSKPIRCLWVLKLLSEDPIHSTELAILFDVSERAIQRDVATLKAAGAVIETTERGYVLRGRYALPFG